LTHSIYTILGDEIKLIVQTLEDKKEEIDTSTYESLCRFVRTRFIIDCATSRKDCFKRNVTMF
jgi:hypothetical protein